MHVRCILYVPRRDTSLGSPSCDPPLADRPASLPGRQRSPGQGGRPAGQRRHDRHLGKLGRAMPPSRPPTVAAR